MLNHDLWTKNLLNSLIKTVSGTNFDFILRIRRAYLHNFSRHMIFINQQFSVILRTCCSVFVHRRYVAARERPPITMLNGHRFRPVINHFIHYSDVKVKGKNNNMAAKEKPRFIFPSTTMRGHFSFD